MCYRRIYMYVVYYTVFASALIHLQESPAQGGTRFLLTPIGIDTHTHTPNVNANFGDKGIKNVSFLADAGTAAAPV